MKIMWMLLLGVYFVSQIVFWLLFFFVVQVRIADKGLVVGKAPRFEFFGMPWPSEEMRTYRRDLTDEERKYLLNRFLCNAGKIGCFLLGMFALALMYTMIARL
jgi:hypothetical protein